MGMITHYKNKFPGGHVQESETSIDVYDAKGQHQVALRKNGAGQWICKSEEYGLDSRHCLSAIPKDARVYKRTKDGKHGLAEEAEARRKKSKQFERNGRIASIEELTKEGYVFDAQGNLLSAPKKEESEAN